MLKKNTRHFKSIWTENSSSTWTRLMLLLFSPLWNIFTPLPYLECIFLIIFFFTKRSLLATIMDQMSLHSAHLQPSGIVTPVIFKWNSLISLVTCFDWLIGLTVKLSSHGAKLLIPLYPAPCSLHLITLQPVALSAVICWAHSALFCCVVVCVFFLQLAE